MQRKWLELLTTEGNGIDMTAHLSDPFTAASLVELSVRRLGERTCVINVGTELRHVELPVVDEAVEGGRCTTSATTSCSTSRSCAATRRSRWCGSHASGTGWPASGCAIHVAAREARVVADLERLAGSVGWDLHPSTTHALRALLSAPVD